MGKYIGKFLNDKYHGPGVLIYGDGFQVKKYDGEFRGGKWHGFATVEFKDGRIYEGECVNGGINGYGKMLVPREGVYEGEFSDGLKEGNVVFCDIQGNRSKARYDDDRLVERLRLDDEDKGKGVWKRE